MSENQEHPYVVAEVPANWHSLSKSEQDDFIKDLAARMHRPPLHPTRAEGSPDPRDDAE